MFAGVLVSVHEHPTDGHQANNGSVSSCGCPSHQESEQFPGERDNQDDDCSVCRLIAEFQAETPIIVELEFDTMVSCHCEWELPTTPFSATRLVRCRAPPETLSIS